MPMLLAPVVGQLAERWGGKPLVVTGLSLQAAGLAWLASVTTPTTPYADLVAPFVVCGVGMTLFFVPLASLVLGAVPRSLEGVASGANAAFRELGGVLGHRRAGGHLQLPRRLRLGPGLRQRDDRRRSTPAPPWWPSGPSPPCWSPAVARAGPGSTWWPPRCCPDLAGCVRRPARRGRGGRGSPRSPGVRVQRRSSAGASGRGRARSRRSAQSGVMRRARARARGQDVGGLGPELGQGPVPVDPDPEVDLGDRLHPEERGHVDQQGQLDGVAVGQPALLEHPPGGGGLAGQGLLDAGQVGEEQVDDGSGHELGDPAAPVGRAVEGPLVVPLDQGHRVVHQQGPEQAA